MILDHISKQKFSRYNTPPTHTTTSFCSIVPDNIPRMNRQKSYRPKLGAALQFVHGIRTFFLVGELDKAIRRPTVRVLHADLGGDFLRLLF